MEFNHPAGGGVDEHESHADGFVAVGIAGAEAPPRSEVRQVTMMRDGRSVFDQMTPRPSVVSPAITPETTRGRLPCAMSGTPSEPNRKVRLLAFERALANFILLYFARLAGQLFCRGCCRGCGRDGQQACRTDGVANLDGDWLIT